MKRILAPFLSFSILLTGCSKDQSFEILNVVETPQQPTSYHLRFDNGSSVESYDGATVFATKMALGGTTSYMITGVTMSGRSLVIALSSMTATDLIAGTTYKTTENVGGFDASVTYVISMSEMYASNATDPFEIKVVTISNTEISGTFQGTLSGGTGPKNISSGTFRAKFQ